jgi:hypothetical protein
MLDVSTNFSKTSNSKLSEEDPFSHSQVLTRGQIEINTTKLIGAFLQFSFVNASKIGNENTAVHPQNTVLSVTLFYNSESTAEVMFM